MRRLPTALLLLALALPLPAQTLARRNWAGSGLAVEPWYHHAVLYQLNPLHFQPSAAGDSGGPGDLRGVLQRLPYLQSLGLDALLLSPLDQIETSPEDTDSFDQLVAEASRQRIRILVDLPLNGPNPLALARFWLTHGVAGLRLVSSSSLPPLAPADRNTLLPQLHQLVDSYPGARILLSDLTPADPTATLIIQRPFGTASPVTMPLLQAIVAAVPSSKRLRHAAPPPPEPVLALDTAALGTGVEPGEPDRSDRSDRLLATLLFTAPAGVLLRAGQEIGRNAGQNASGEPTPMPWGSLPVPSPEPEPQPPPTPAPKPPAPEVFAPYTPYVQPASPPPAASAPEAPAGSVAREDADPDSLLNFVRALSALHGTSPALRTGSSELVSTGIPGLLAFLRRPAPGTGAPVVVLLNLSDQPVVVSLRPALTRLGLGRAILRSLLSSPTSSPTLDSITLPPRTSFLGELALHSGLETGRKTNRSKTQS